MANSQFFRKKMWLALELIDHTVVLFLSYAFLTFLQNLMWLNIASFGTLKEVGSHNEVQAVVHTIMPTKLNLPLKATSCSEQLERRPIFKCIFWELTGSCPFLIKAFIEIRCCLGLLDMFICMYLVKSNKISYNSIN